MQSKDKDLAALRKKEQNFQSAIDNIQSQLDAETKRSRDLDGQVNSTSILLHIALIEILAQTTAKTIEYGNTKFSNSET